VRRSLRAARLSVWSLLDRVRPGDDLVPRGHAGLTGGGDFEQVGEEFLGHFRALGGLRPSGDVLEVGCGLGRMAVPLTRYLDGGSYRGFDVMAPAVESCRRRVTARYPSFRFDHLDVFNGKYNPGGRISPFELEFPYGDDAFDLVVATSVFTHMRRPEIERYLHEVARVLKPDGRSLITWFVVDAETASLIRAGRTDPRLVAEDDGVWVADPKEPELAIGYDETLVRELYGRAALTIVEPPRYGRWRGSPGLSYQDIVVAGRSDPRGNESRPYRLTRSNEATTARASAMRRAVAPRPNRTFTW